MRNIFKLGDQSGVAAVEMAIMLPLLLILFAGIIEFGIAYYNKQIITNASREGTRAGMANADNIEEIVHKYAQDRLITFGPFSPPSVEKEYFDVSGTEYVRVTVNFEYSYLILEGFSFFGADFNKKLPIGASNTMKMM